MKAIVVEIRDALAAVLSDDGSMYRVKNNKYTVGQVIEMKKQIPRNIRKVVAWAASAAAVLLVCATSAWAYYTPYSYVSLDVNPSIEFSLNRFNIVLSAKGVNSDGEEILSGLHIGSLKNMHIQEAIALTVQQISDEGYFDGETGGGIVVAASSEDEETAEELAGQLQETIEQEDTENGDTVEVEAVSVGLERVQKARELGVTPGKLNLVEKLQASADDPASIDIQLWLEKPVKEIMKAIKENRKANPTDIGENDGTETDPVLIEPSAAPDTTPAPAVTPAAGQNESEKTEQKQLEAQAREEERLRKEQEQAEKKAAQQQQQEEKKAAQKQQEEEKSSSGKKN